MENKYLKARKWVILGAILLVLTLTISGSYALWNYFKVGENQRLVAGEIYMKYTETSNTINIQDAMPSNTYDENEYFQFTIEGKNTYTKPIWYEIVIKWGEKPTDRNTRIPDEFIRFRLTEQLPDGEEQEVIKEGKYTDFSKGTKIWVNKIAANSPETTITYKLYMWISDEMHLGAGEDAASSDMDMDTWNTDAFASVKVTVNGDFEEKTLAIEQKEPEGIAKDIISKVNSNDKELQAVNTDGAACDSLEDCEIKEYRYSGPEVNNYVKLKNTNPTSKEEQDETWRILGVFKDSDNDEWFLRLVREESLSEDYLPETYNVGDKSYKFKVSDNNVYYGYLLEGIDYANSSNYLNYWIRDWEKAAISHYLNETSDGVNTGYRSYLANETIKLLEKRKTIDKDISETWQGEVTLMDWNDFMYACLKSEWLEEVIFEDKSETNWIAKLKDSTWSTCVESDSWVAGGMLAYDDVQNRAPSKGIKPVLNLKSTVKVKGMGDGTLENPYELEI